VTDTTTAPVGGVHGAQLLAAATNPTMIDELLRQAKASGTDVAGLVAMVSAQPVDAGDIVEDTGDDDTEEPT